MPWCWLLIGFASAQPFQVVIGTVASSTNSALNITSSADTYTLFRDSETKIWRGRNYPDFSVLHPGDDVSVRYRRDPDGRLVVNNLYANIDHVSGIITQVSKNGFQVYQNFDADPHSGYRRQYRDIAYDLETAFEDSAAEDLRPGRTVDIIGLKLDKVRVQGTRITIYEGNRPVRMRDGKVFLPDGRIQERKP